MPIHGESIEVKRDPLIRYGFFAGVLLSAICLVFTIVYISSYSKNTETSFNTNAEIYLKTSDISVLSAVLTARTAQNKVLLQSCGVVAGIAFGFLGFSLFLLGIQGDIQIDGKVVSHAFSMRRLTPGSLILIAALIMVCVCAIHEIKFDLHLNKIEADPQSFTTDLPKGLLSEHPNNDKP